MKTNQLNIILFGLLVLSIGMLTAQKNWVLEKDDSGIKIFTKKEEQSKFNSFKATTTIEASIHDFIAVFSDISLFPKWGYKIDKAKLLERKGDTLQIYYSTAKVPFPYKDRDGIYKNTFSWDSKSQTLLIGIEILEDYIPLDNKYERVKGSGFWKIKKVNPNRIDIVFSMQIDPGGNIPAWMANMSVEDSPYTSLKNIKQILESGSFTKRTYSFIED